VHLPRAALAARGIHHGAAPRRAHLAGARAGLGPGLVADVLLGEAAALRTGPADLGRAAREPVGFTGTGRGLRVGSPGRADARLAGVLAARPGHRPLRRAHPGRKLTLAVVAALELGAAGGPLFERLGGALAGRRVARSPGALAVERGAIDAGAQVGRVRRRAVGRRARVDRRLHAPVHGAEGTRQIAVRVHLVLTRRALVAVRRVLARAAEGQRADDHARYDKLVHRFHVRSSHD